MPCHTYLIRAAQTGHAEALGLRADFHPTEVNRIERGRRNPGLLTIVRLCKALDIPPCDLLAGI
jgi:transcriptional regulator with XRE-family HTH domain